MIFDFPLSKQGRIIPYFYNANIAVLFYKQQKKSVFLQIHRHIVLKGGFLGLIKSYFASSITSDGISLQRTYMLTSAVSESAVSTILFSSSSVTK